MAACVSDLTDAETGAMLRAFFNLAARWRLDDGESRILLGEPAARTYDRWKSDQFAPSRISRDTRERLSVLMGIHRNLRSLFPDPSCGYRWIRKPNRAFGGESALNRMLAGSVVDLAVVRAYLDAESSAGGTASRFDGPGDPLCATRETASIEWFESRVT